METPEGICLHDLGAPVSLRRLKFCLFSLQSLVSPKMTERIFKEANEADKLQRLSMWELFSSFTSYTSSKVVGGADLPHSHYSRN